MNKNLILNNLSRFGYNYSDQGQWLEVKLDCSLQMIIDFSDPDKVIIKDRLKSWNFLTGSIQMSLKGSMIYNFIGVIICALGWCYFVERINQFYLIISFLTLIFWIIYWTTFYLIKSESFKRQIIDWIRNE